MNNYKKLKTLRETNTGARLALQLLVALGSLAALQLSLFTQDSRAEQQELQFKDARLKFEVNATDGDGGVQMFLDADDWETVSIFDPKGKKIFYVRARGRIKKQGGTELFLESAEPDFSELSLEQLLQRFPAGKYQFRGRTLDGEELVGEALLTHNIPDGPELLSPAPDVLQDPQNTVVTWAPVAAPNGSPIIGYQVLVVQSDTGFPALPKVALDIIMPADATSLAVPPGFLLPDTEYEWEVLAIESGGNQTLSSSFFRTTP